MGEAFTGNPATDFSIALLAGLVRAGVRDVVVCPGSRSQALALVAAELDRVGAVRLHVRVDERGAGFFALGTALESGTPAAVVTTSGTAAANLHPAVLEAHHANVPLIVITSDRPAEVRGIRSNQTTRQPGLFGPSVRLMEDVAAPDGLPGELGEAERVAWSAVECATGAYSAEPGPVQVNLALREPLSVAVPDLSAIAEGIGAEAAVPGPGALAEGVVGRVVAEAADGLVARVTGGIDADREDADRATPEAGVSSPPPADPAGCPPVRSAAAGPRSRPVHTVGPRVRTVVIAGAEAGEEAEAFARAGGWPLLAEVSSGARFGPSVVAAYRELLDLPDFGGRVERAVVFGHPTLSRQVPALLGRDDVEVIVVAPTGAEVYNPRRRAAVVARSVRVADGIDPRSADAREWVGRWVAASRAIVDGTGPGDASSSGRAPADLSAPIPPSEQVAVARAALAALREPVDRRMLVSAVWRYTWPQDRLVLGASRLIREIDRIVPGKKIRVFANRGLAGIDGTVSTALGIALKSRRVAEETGRASGTTRVLLGDLTLLHDVGALLIGTGEDRPQVQLIVGNDGGGTIFDSLEVASSADRGVLDRVLFTPQDVDFGALASAYGWAYVRASNRGELDAALSAPPVGPSILEVPLGR